MTGLSHKPAPPILPSDHEQKFVSDTAQILLQLYGWFMSCHSLLPGLVYVIVISL